MPVFTDKSGREWKVEVDFATVLDWKAECGIDLGDAEQAIPALTRAVLQDPFKLAELLWVACREKAGATTRDQFARGLPADTDALREAIYEGVVLFFHGPKRGPSLMPILRRMLSGDESTSNDSPTNSPESSAESPTPAP